MNDQQLPGLAAEAFVLDGAAEGAAEGLVESENQRILGGRLVSAGDAKKVDFQISRRGWGKRGGRNVHGVPEGGGDYSPRRPAGGPGRSGKVLTGSGGQ